jgi:histone H3/H4
MGRIDVQTLVLAFEKRIEELEKNPPDKVPTSVIIKMLENSIDELLRSHFKELIRRELEIQIKQEFKQMLNEYTHEIITNIFKDEDFKNAIEKKIKINIEGHIVKI